MSLHQDEGGSRQLMPQNRSRKRKGLETPTSECSASKKQKVNPESEEPFPPAFWDSLSKIHLTKLALNELNRRNAEAAIPSKTVKTSSRGRRPRLVPAGEYLRNCTKHHLKEVKRTARHGGPDLSDTRYPSEIPHVSHTFMEPPRNPTPSNRRSRSNPAAVPNGQTTTTGESSGPYNQDFRQKLIDEGIYPPDYISSNGQEPPKAANWQDLKQKLIKPRRSLSPSKFSEEDFERFQRASKRVQNESQVRHSVFSVVEGNVDESLWSGGGTVFNNLERLIPNVTQMATPDIYNGAHPTEIDVRVREELDRLVVPSTSTYLPAAPNFFVELKGPKGSLDVAERQACYYSALGARGVRSLQEYAQGCPINDEKACTLSATFVNRSTITFYATHPVESDKFGGRPEYIMHKLRSFDMTNDSETFRQGAAYYRNARDLAKEMRDEAISKANEKARSTALASGGNHRQSSSSVAGLMLDGASSPKPQGDDSETSPTDQSNTTPIPVESEASSLELEPRGPTKRPLEHTRGLSQPTLKKVNTGESEEIEP